MHSTIQLIDAQAAAAALLHPVRGQLLEQFREPRSAAEVARNLDLPRQRVGHHVRVLRDRGLLEKAGERRTGNFVEKLLQATARVYVIAPQALGGLGLDAGTLRDRFSSEYLASSAARTLRELAALRRTADETGKRVATLTLETEVRFSDSQQQAAFAEEIAQALATISAKYHDARSPQGRRFRFTLGGHPTADPRSTDSPAADPPATDSPAPDLPATDSLATDAVSARSHPTDREEDDE